MKTITFLLVVLCSMGLYGQTENKGAILINETQTDDTYLAGEAIEVNSVIKGDLVMAGGNLMLKDSVYGDFTAAGGELVLKGYIEDDVRIAVGRVTIDSEIGDDLVVFGGEVILTENAKVHGDLKCFAGNIQMNGKVNGKLAIKGADVLIDGTVKKTSKIIGEDIIIGSHAKFHQEVQYWNSGGELEFNNALVNTKAQFKEDLGEDISQLTLTTFGTRSIKLWLTYILSSFLAILVFHALFRNAFLNAVDDLEQSVLKSFGFGLMYLLGIPLFILLTFLMAIGIPLGLFATAVFVFSLLFGHLVSSLLIVYYLRHRNQKNWGFWSITFLALACAIALRLITMIPFAGILISVVILSITYGALTLNVLHPKKQLVKI
ncbi:MAG: polymer-forming cytoskeletal protein [Bacteroidota bacterium]